MRKEDLDWLLSHEIIRGWACWWKCAWQKVDSTVGSWYLGGFRWTLDWGLCWDYWCSESMYAVGCNKPCPDQTWYFLCLYLRPPNAHLPSLPSWVAVLISATLLWTALDGLNASHQNDVWTWRWSAWPCVVCIHLGGNIESLTCLLTAICAVQHLTTRC